MFADLFVFFSDNYVSPPRPRILEGAAVHDPLAVLALTHPELFDRVRPPRRDRDPGELTRGMTVIDQRTHHRASAGRTARC